MDNVIFKEATQDDIDFIAQNMRQADIDEVLASCNQGPQEALENSVRMSEEVVSVNSDIDGTPLVLFGVKPKGLLSDVGVPWMLGCDEALKYRRAFMTQTPLVLSIWLERYAMLENFVHIKNKISIRWLKKLGFKMDDPIIFRNSGEYFIRFHMEK